MGERSTLPDAGWVAACRRDTLHVSGGRIVMIDGCELVLFVNDGDVVAIKNQCPHRDVPLDDALVEDGCLTCTWHGWRFELATGDHLTAFGPRRGLTTYPVRVIDDVVWVAKQPTVSMPSPSPSLPLATVPVSARYL